MKVAKHSVAKNGYAVAGGNKLNKLKKKRKKKLHTRFAEWAWAFLAAPSFIMITPGCYTAVLHENMRLYLLNGSPNSDGGPPCPRDQTSEKSLCHPAFHLQLKGNRRRCLTVLFKSIEYIRAKYL